MVDDFVRGYFVFYEYDDVVWLVLVGWCGFWWFVVVGSLVCWGWGYFVVWFVIGWSDGMWGVCWGYCSWLLVIGFVFLDSVGL